MYFELLGCLLQFYASVFVLYNRRHRARLVMADRRNVCCRFIHRLLASGSLASEVVG